MESIINECIKKDEYFLRFEELYVYFDEFNISYNERKEILKQINEHNKKIYGKEKEISREFMKLKNQSETIIKISTDFKISTQYKENKVEPLHCDIKDYFSKIKDCKDLEEIISLLPDRNNVEFDNILSVILVKLYALKVEILNFMKQYKDDVYEIFENDLNEIEEKIEIILDYKNQKEENNELTSTENKVVFLKNSNNEPIIFQNLKGNEEYYDSFFELFNSIIDGSFKNMGTYKNNNKLNDLYKVKLFKTRIIFSRINENTFAILGAFIKKCDNDSRHRNFLQNLSLSFESQHNHLLEIADNEELMKFEEDYKNELVYMLKNKKKVR